MTPDTDEFLSFAYTPLEQALAELARRRQDQTLTPPQPSLPVPFASGPKAVLFRHLATPNYETRCFVAATQATKVLEPVVLEYTHDRFSDINEWKCSAAKIPFYKSTDPKGQIQFEALNVLDFNISRGRPLGELQTRWGQSLVEFHHELFRRAFPDLQNGFFDLSDWLHENGPSARAYYQSFLKLFIRDGILFDNFLLEGPEVPFNQTVVLPSLTAVIKETGLKPLIVPLLPQESAGSKYWLCQPPEDKKFVTEKLKSAKIKR